MEGIHQRNKQHDKGVADNRSQYKQNRFSVGEEIPEITLNLTTVTDNLKKVSEELKNSDLSNTLASLDETITNLKLLSQKINSPNNSVGKLVNGSELHDSLVIVINSATKLLEDIRENPKRYLSVKLRLF